LVKLTEKKKAKNGQPWGKLAIALAVGLLVVGAFTLYPKPQLTHLVTCDVVNYAIISINTYVSSTVSGINLTETHHVTNYTTSTNPAESAGLLTGSATSSSISGYNGVGQFTLCTYISNSRSTDNSSQ
jgi:hypothetical protein